MKVKIYSYRITLSLVPLHGCETWSATLGVESRLRVLESRTLKIIFGSGREEVTEGENCITRTSIICAFQKILLGISMAEHVALIGG
jgi:hypothetical protein